MNIEQIMKDLEKMGTPSVKKIFINHGAQEPLFGVKIADLKKNSEKKLKKNNVLSLELYKTGNADAMYLAGLIADEKEIQKKRSAVLGKKFHFSYDQRMYSCLDCSRK
nr:DNA alkylation repair enzyme [Leptospira interrogans serovar Copenhageni/Icterohaemorrhagiae]